MAKVGHFDAIASRYDIATRLLMMGTHDRVRDRIVSSAPPAETALDLCCGTGYLTGHIRADQVVGLDLSTGMLSVNEKKNGDKENVDLVNGDAFNLPFDTDGFDAVFCSLASPEFERYDEILNEVKRVLRDGGELRIYDVYKSPHLIDKPFVFFMHYVVEKGHFYIRSEEGWRRLLNEKGFHDFSLDEIYLTSALVKAKA